MVSHSHWQRGYEEPEDGTGIEEINDGTTWEKKSSWTLETAKTLLGTVGDLFESPTLRYLKNYISINVNGNNFFWLRKRSSPKSLLGFRIADEQLDEVAKILDAQNISYVQKRGRFRFTVDKASITTRADTLKKIAQHVRQTWQK